MVSVWYPSVSDTSGPPHCQRETHTSSNAARAMPSWSSPRSRRAVLSPVEAAQLRVGKGRQNRPRLQNDQTPPVVFEEEKNALGRLPRKGSHRFGKKARVPGRQHIHAHDAPILHVRRGHRHEAVSRTKLSSPRRCAALCPAAARFAQNERSLGEGGGRGHRHEGQGEGEGGGRRARA